MFLVCYKFCTNNDHYNTIMCRTTVDDDQIPVGEESTFRDDIKNLEKLIYSKLDKELKSVIKQDELIIISWSPFRKTLKECIDESNKKE